MSEPTRLTILPTRALTMNEQIMEFAYQDDQAIYLVTYVPRPGAPSDPTKREFDVSLDVLNDQGVPISPVSRTATHTVLFDPSIGIQTPPGETPAVQILREVGLLIERSRPWIAQILDPTPLYEQLMP